MGPVVLATTGVSVSGDAPKVAEAPQPFAIPVGTPPAAEPEWAGKEQGSVEVGDAVQAQGETAGSGDEMFHQCYAKVSARRDSFWFDNAWYGCEAGGLTARGSVSSVSDVDELQPEDAIFDGEECETATGLPSNDALHPSTEAVPADAVVSNTAETVTALPSNDTLHPSTEGVPVINGEYVQSFAVVFKKQPPWHCCHTEK
ncbi:hypothetical protein HPB50_021557 [Hyalomma asiaticum]|uniref:Uncharacterized protein n=1 Tax=Hyalomma asiaticum TaxID=266040 RepID=A0ACB7T0X1_HYAAI|nr:hypothetical protein HPB50_021557 [Hyalomma asiaticum]